MRLSSVCGGLLELVPSDFCYPVPLEFCPILWENGWVKSEDKGGSNGKGREKRGESKK